MVLFTDQSGRQTVRMRFRTNGEEEQANNERADCVHIPETRSSFLEGRANGEGRPHGALRDGSGTGAEAREKVRSRGEQRIKGEETVTEIFRKSSKSNRHI